MYIYTIVTNWWYSDDDCIDLSTTINDLIRICSCVFDLKGRERESDKT